VHVDGIEVVRGTDSNPTFARRQLADHRLNTHKEKKKGG
jgi:hypothetical protein